MKLPEKLRNTLPVIKEWAGKAGETAGKIIHKFKNLKKPVKVAACIVLAIAVAGTGIGVAKWSASKKAASENSSGTSIVMQGSLINSITGSGTVEPIEQRDIVPEVNGKIIESPFNEGDEVKENDVLYRFEMTAAENAIKSAENNVEKARTTLSNRQNSIEKVRENISALTVRATASGKISGLALQVGEEVSGKICTITNFKEQTATVPFSSAQIGSIKVGDKVDVAIDKYMINTTGTVVRKYTAPETLSSGAVVYNVEIRLSGDYVVEENINVTATVRSSAGNISSASYGSVEYAAPVTVSAEQKGKVSKINFKNGDWVNEGDVIAVLKNTDLTDELRTAQQNYSEATMSLSEAENNLEDKMEEAQDYIVTSPINGVILTKDYTVGDTISGQNSTTMMVVADMSKMKFTISVDELDIAKIQLGQSVQVTADALENSRLTGEITSVSKLGTSSNGVTNYPVEVTINDPGELMPGMNVSAEIIVEQVDNCLYLPLEAVEYFGGKYYVTVVGEVENMPQIPQRPQRETSGGQGVAAPSEKDASAEKSGNNAPTEGGAPERPAEGRSFVEGERGDGMPDSENAPRGQRMNEDVPAQNSEQTENSKQSAENAAEKKSAENTEQKSSEKEAPANAAPMQDGGNRQQRAQMEIKLSGKEERVEVEIGIATDEYYEIKSGVTLGQVVKNTSQTTSSSSGTMPGMMGGGMPGMMGGGMPGGGMPGGGMPAGGMGGRR